MFLSESKPFVGERGLQIVIDIFTLILRRCVVGLCQAQPDLRGFVMVAVAIASLSGYAAGHDRVPAPQSRSYQGMRVEATVPVATDVPDRVLVSWQGDPATSFAVTWRTLAGPSAVGEIAKATDGPSFVKNIERAQARTSDLKTSLGTVHMHAVTFTDLEPETQYVYRVGSLRTEGATDEYAWSEWFQMRTAAKFTGKVAPLRFVYVGDAQNDVKSHWSRLIRESYRDAPRMTFMLHAGDLVNRGNQDHEWGQWFHAGDFIFATVPQLAIPGNHEYDVDLFAAKLLDKTRRQLSRRWAQRFEFPQNGPEGATENIYYVDVQGVRLIGLDSNVDPEPQAKWLEGVLKENPNRWTIVTHHHPIYSTSRGRDNPALRKYWQPLYEKYGVDLVLQGHDHSYGRSEPLAVHEHEHNEPTGLTVAGKHDGPVYVVSVSGPKMYPLKDYPEGENPFEKHLEGTQLYQVIEIEHGELRYEAKSATGKLFDRFRILKDEEGSGKFED